MTAMDWRRAGRARDRAVPRGHGGAAGRCRPTTTSAPSSRSRWSIELVQRLARPGRRLRGRRRPLLLRAPPTRTSARCRASTATTMLRALRRARRRPRPAGQEGPAGLPAVARRAAGRAGWDRPFGPGGPAGTSSARAIALDHLGRRSTSRAAAATWSSRTTRWAPPGPGGLPGERVRAAPTCTPAWSASTARRCRSPRATWSSSPRCAQRGVDPMAIRLALLRPPLPQRLGVDRRPALGRRGHRLARLARGARRRRRRPPAAGGRARPGRPRRRPGRPARGRRRRRLGRPAARSATTAVRDTAGRDAVGGRRRSLGRRAGPSTL